MMKQFKKVLSILCAIALLVTSLTFALAEEPAEQPVGQEPVVEEPVVEEPVIEEPVVEEPVVEEPKAEEPMVEEPVVEEPMVEGPKAEEPVVEEPMVEEPKAEEPAAEETASEVKEEVPTEDEATEEACAEEEAFNNTDDEDDEEDDGLVPLEDNEGYVDQEVIEENTPAITDELKGLRNADLFVGQALSDYLRFGDELTVTLRGCDASTIELQLYIPVGASVNTKVDGKAVSFTPADCEDSSLNLYTYELTNAAGRTHEIVLTSYDDVPFQLAAVVMQVEEIVEETPVQKKETPAAEENNEAPAAEDNNETPVEEINEAPAEGSVNDTPADDAQSELPEETPTPTIQVSVKTYEALKVGRSISDSLVAAQKAKIQVKCGKNPYVTLTLNANPDDVVVTIDGEAAEFTAAGNGTYSCDLDEVAFRKFTVVVLAKQDLEFTLSASARQVEGADVEEEDEDAEEESEDTNKEETAEEVTEEPAEEAEEATEETEEIKKEVSEEELAEASEEEPSEEVTEEDAETSEEEGEEAEGEEDNTKEDNEEAAPAYINVVVSAEEGADIYAEANKEAEVVGHLDAGEEALVILNEEGTWAQIYSEDEEAAAQFISMEDAEIVVEEDAEEEAEGTEPLTDEQLIELGYRKVQILNKDGADIYAAAEEEAEVIGHADFESELWIKDTEAEGWAEVYTEKDPEAEDEIKQFIKLAEIEKQTPSDEEMLEAGYIKVYVAIDIGANIYGGPVEYENEEPIDHLDSDIELWVKLIEEADRAQIFDLNEETEARFINLVDIIATMKPEWMEDLPTRELKIISSLDGIETVRAGTINHLEVQLINFREDDIYKVQWKYSEDGEEFIDIEGAEDLKFAYFIDISNTDYIWRAYVVLKTPEEMLLEAVTPEEILLEKVTPKE